MMRQRLIHSKLFDFPRWKLIAGIAIALLTSFCWYAFFYVMREAMRVVFYWKTYHATYQIRFDNIILLSVKIGYF